MVSPSAESAVQALESAHPFVRALFGSCRQLQYLPGACSRGWLFIRPLPSQNCRAICTTSLEGSAWPRAGGALPATSILAARETKTCAMPQRPRGVFQSAQCEISARPTELSSLAYVSGELLPLPCRTFATATAEISALFVGRRLFDNFS